MDEKESKKETKGIEEERKNRANAILKKNKEIDK